MLILLDGLQVVLIVRLFSHKVQGRTRLSKSQHPQRPASRSPRRSVARVEASSRKHSKRSQKKRRKCWSPEPFNFLISSFNHVEASRFACLFHFLSSPSPPPVNAGKTINHPFIDASQITSYLHDHLFLSAHFHLLKVLRNFLSLLLLLISRMLEKAVPFATQIPADFFRIRVKYLSVPVPCVILFSFLVVFIIRLFIAHHPLALLGLASYFIIRAHFSTNSIAIAFRFASTR